MNTILGASEVIATRRLPSGDIILVFNDHIPGSATKQQEWVQKAFGPTAKLYESEFAVLAKGLPVDRLNRTATQQILQDLQTTVPDITRCKVELARTSTARYTTAVVHLRSVEAAKRLCERGLVWQAQIFNCEPYSTELRPRRCFSCHQFGHIGRYCRNKARCGHCAGVAHLQGEGECPQLASGKKKCINCRGPHLA